MVGGKVQKQQAVDNGVANVVKAGDEGSAQTASVLLPAGALSSSSSSLKLVNNPAVVPPDASGVVSIKVVVEISLTAQTALSNGKTALVTLNYQDANGDGIVDGTAIRIDRLVMYSAASAAGPWIRDLSSTVDRSSKTVTGNTGHFSFFGLFAPAAATLDGVRVYPNPFMPNGGNSDKGVPYNGSALSGITFDNLII